MTQANLTLIQDKQTEILYRVAFSRAKTFDSFMFKNNLFNWLFTNSLGDFEISADNQNNTFLVKLTERRDSSKLFRAFPNITFEELDIRPKDMKEYLEKLYATEQ